MKVAEDTKLREQVVRASRATDCQRPQWPFASAWRAAAKLIFLETEAPPRTRTTGRWTASFQPAGLSGPFLPFRSLSNLPTSPPSRTTSGTEVIFLRQLIAHARPDDVAVGISTSGGSKNIIMALEEARKRNLLTVALLGYDGGEILRRGLVDWPVVVRSDYIPRIQEVQASMYHVIRQLLEIAGHA
jgi:D-sedoheptulose 7-phosphate isomerase